MLNECVQIGLEGNVSGLKTLSLKCYRQLDGYDVLSYYKLCAISKAVGILRNYRKAKRRNVKVKEPYVRKQQLITCYGFKVKDGKLHLPIRPRRSIEIPLNRHVLSTISGKGLMVRSVTLTPETVNLAYGREVSVIKPVGLLGIDRNLNNVTVASTDRSVGRFDLSEATEVKAVYRLVKSNLTRNDVRIRRRLTHEYGVRERNKVNQILHNASRMIVQEAQRNRYGIVMENLTGIRKLYRKGNGQGREYRSRLNGWSYAELQRQIEYKARWEGLPVIYVPAQGTSRKCAVCGCRMLTIPEEHRTLKCTGCGHVVDRDVNAARNILAKAIKMRALRFGAVASAGEAMVTESVRQQVIRRVDADELTISHELRS